MNKKQWYVLAFIFLILFLLLAWTANFYDDAQWNFGDLAIKTGSDSSIWSMDTMMINDNIYRMGSYFAFALALGFYICGLLEPPLKKT